MHIMEGFLPHPWWEVWYALSLPVVVYGIYKMNQLVKERRETLPLLAVAGAFMCGQAVLTLAGMTAALAATCRRPHGKARCAAEAALRLLFARYEQTLGIQHEVEVFAHVVLVVLDETQLYVVCRWLQGDEYGYGIHVGTQNHGHTVLVRAGVITVY